MKISLRKANALQGVIAEQIMEPFGDSVVIGKFDNPEEVISAGASTLIGKILQKQRLVKVLFDIRKKVGQKSAEVGISGLLTDLAYNEKQAAFYKQLAGTKSFLPKMEVVNAALADIKAEQPNSYSRRDSITVNLLAKEVVDSYKKNIQDIRKEKQKISDRLLHLNVSSEIELDESEVAVLTKYDIL